MSITGGIILYAGAVDNAPNENLRGLIINVSASLLSIPLVFLLYDYTNSRVARQMKKNLTNSMSDRLNILMLNIIIMLREMMNVRSKISTENINRMLMWRAPEISKRLKITPKIKRDLHEYHNDLDTLLYRNGQNEVINPDVFQTLSSLSREMTRLINENKFRHNKRLSAKYVEGMMAHILDWLDSDSVAALNLQQHITNPSEKTPIK
jgi:hypothetical protein